MGPLLITGASGLLGAHLAAELHARGAPFVAWRGVRGVPFARHVDLTDDDAVRRAFDEAAPRAIVHAAAISAAADCARDPARAYAVNVEATARLARLAAASGATFVYVSTDLVFDGEAAPYAEGAARAPLSVYGRTKAEGEDAAREATGARVVRVALLFGRTAGPRQGFFDLQASAILRGEPMTLFDDEWRTPLSLLSAAEGLLAVADAETAPALLHLGGPERMSRLEMGRRLAVVLGAPSAHVRAASRLSIPGEPRARDVSLDSARFRAAFPSFSTGTFEEEVKRIQRRVDAAAGSAPGASALV